MLQGRGMRLGRVIALGSLLHLKLMLLSCQHLLLLLIVHASAQVAVVVKLGVTGRSRARLDPTLVSGGLLAGRPRDKLLLLNKHLLT